MFTDLESDLEAEIPSVVSQVYTRDQQGIEDIKTLKNRLPPHLPRELREGKILKSSEAITNREPQCPPLTDAIAEEHELFHEAQGLSFPLKCPFCWQEERDETEKAKKIRLKKEADEAAARRRRADREAEAEEPHLGHLDRGYVARSCILCQQTQAWHDKFDGAPGKVKLGLSNIELGVQNGGHGITINRTGGSVQIYLGSWSTERTPFARWCGYQLVRGARNPYERPKDLSAEEEKFIEARLRERFAAARVAIVEDAI